MALKRDTLVGIRDNSAKSANKPKQPTYLRKYLKKVASEMQNRIDSLQVSRPKYYKKDPFKS